MIRSPRTGAAALCVAGVALGAVTDTVAPRTPPRAGEYWILSGDLHVHAFPGDGWLTPPEIVREAARAGLDVVAITSHNDTRPARLGRWLAPGDGPIVLVGQEITNPAYHLIAAGIERDVDWWQPAAGAIADVQAQGGVAIAAHPGRDLWAGFDDRARAMLDGVEAVDGDGRASPRTRQDMAAFYRSTRAHNPTVAPIGSSDFHGRSRHGLGHTRTYFLVRDRTADGVLEAIRAGRTVVLDAHGALHGEPDVVRMVEGNEPAGRLNANRRWRWLAVLMAWVGLVAMVLLRGRGTRT